MNDYQKNNFRREVIQLHGQEAGLPLFEAANKQLSNRTQSRFDAAPKSIPTGNETKRLHRVSQKINEVQLNEDCQIVFDAFAALGPSSNREVSAYLKNLYPEQKDKWEAGMVSARNNDLREWGKMTIKTKKDGSPDKRPCKITGNVVTIWKIIEAGNAA